MLELPPANKREYDKINILPGQGYRIIEGQKLMPRSTYFHLVAGCVFSVLGTAVFGETVYELDNGRRFTFYGQFNPALVSFDDGFEATYEIADNEASSSRVGLLYTQTFANNELRFLFETNLGFRTTGEISQTSTPEFNDWDDPRNLIRHIDLIYKTVEYGTFFVGQGSMASDGVGDRSLAGTSFAAPISVSDTAGSFVFRTTSGALSDIEIGAAFATFDGSRRGRLRYETPELNGLTLSIAYGEEILKESIDDTFYDIGLAYESELDNGTELEAGLGFQVRERDGIEDQEDTFASFTFLLPSGVNGTITMGDRNTAGRYYFVKLGYILETLNLGSTAISVDYYSGSDAISTGDSSEGYGFGIVQSFDAANIEAYFGYRNYSYSDTSTTFYQDAESLVLGARWRF